MPTITIHDVVKVPVGLVREAPWNANKCNKKTMARIRASLELYGSVENSVLRPSWCIGARTDEEIAARRATLMGDPEFFETLSGNHRLRIYRETGVQALNATIVEVDDPKAKVLAQALNRTRGVNDDPEKLTALLKDVLTNLPPDDITKVLPHTERELLAILRPEDEKDDDVPDVQAVVHSRTGEVYALGPHRLLCGDSSDRGVVEAFIREHGIAPKVMATDPPYGVKLDQGWRDDSGMERDPSATANDDEIEGDDGFAWEPALGIVPVPVAYVWHADRFTDITIAMLERLGFQRRSLIVWNKEALVLGRSDYHWKHEVAWYAVKPGERPWYGGRNQSTVWTAKAPRQLLGANTTGEDKRLPHPTQKPVAIFEPPVTNHTLPGEWVYDPFAGSGTLLIACAKAGRRAALVEKNAKYCDLIRRRWTKWCADNGQEPGPGALV